jgi:hypothetical protein
MKNKVFLSYAYTDRHWVEQFARTLEKKGVDVWFDTHEIGLGEDIREKLQEGLRSSNILIIILSSNSAKSPSIFFEIGAAVADNKRIIPVVIGDIGQENLPLPIIKYHYLRENSPVKAGEEIAKALGKQ